MQSLVRECMPFWREKWWSLWWHHTLSLSDEILPQDRWTLTSPWRHRPSRSPADRSVLVGSWGRLSLVTFTNVGTLDKPHQQASGQQSGCCINRLHWWSMQLISITYILERHFWQMSLKFLQFYMYYVMYERIEDSRKSHNWDNSLRSPIIGMSQNMSIHLVLSVSCTTISCLVFCLHVKVCNSCHCRPVFISTGREISYCRMRAGDQSMWLGRQSLVGSLPNCSISRFSR